MKRIILVIAVFLSLVLFIGGVYIFLYRPDFVIETRNTYNNLSNKVVIPNQTEKLNDPAGDDANSITSQDTSLKVLPDQKTLENDYHIFQTFNNCGPASLSMALSYYGVKKSQKELGEELRPFQHPKGDNDDKTVTLKELEQKAIEMGFDAYARPNGDIEKIKYFISYDIPVITKTWLKKDEDIGHFRIIKGYNDLENFLIQDDSLQGKNIKYTYDEFNEIWKRFNYGYLVIVPKDKSEIVQKILGEDESEKTAWEKTVKTLETVLEKNPNDDVSKFNLSVALYNTEDYKGSVEQFEKVETYLPSRTLWYQIEPLKAYFYLENYQKIFEVSDKILNNGNRAFSELYLLRGNVYEKQGNIIRAIEEYENAVFYNKNLKTAKEALARTKSL